MEPLHIGVTPRGKPHLVRTLAIRALCGYRIVAGAPYHVWKRAYCQYCTQLAEQRK